MRIYIAGPMRGVANYNFPAFFAAEAALKRHGFEVENPAHNPHGRLVDHLRLDVERITRCDAITVLPGFEVSKGAMLEVAMANYIGMPVYLASELAKGECHVVRLGPGKWLTDLGNGPELVPLFDPGPAFLTEPPSGEPAAEAIATKTRFEELLDKMQALHDRKKSDYTGGNADILFNYRSSGELAGIGVTRAIFARLCEKVIRISSILKKGGDTQVADETVEDTCLDLAIISLLLRISFEQEKTNG